MSELGRLARDKISQTPKGAKSFRIRSTAKNIKIRTPSGIASESFKRFLLDEGVQQSIVEQYMREVADMEGTRTMNMNMLAITYYIIIMLGIDTTQQFISLISTIEGKDAFDGQVQGKISKMTPSDVSVTEAMVLQVEIYQEIIRYMYHIFNHREMKL